MATWTDQNEPASSGPFRLKIDATHYLLIDNGGINKLLISPTTTLWQDQAES